MKSWQLILVVLVLVAGIAGAVAITQLSHKTSPTLNTTKPPVTNTTHPVNVSTSPPVNNTTKVTSTSNSSNTTLKLPPGAEQLKFDAQNKTVFIYLTVTSANGYINYNGTTYGSLKIYVPVGWNVYLTFYNQAPLNHGLALIENNTEMPNQPNVLQDGKVLLLLGYDNGNGIPAGFSVSGLYQNISAGYYWLACPVFGHAESGMWVDLIASNNVSIPYELM